MTPPRWTAWLLDTFGHPDTREEVQGDLLELYAYWAQTLGERRANWRYSLSVLKLLRPLAKQKATDYSTPFFLSPDMLLNYFKIARRHLWRNRLFTVLNVLGLSIGLSACWIIYRIVSFEFSFDAQNPNRDRIVRVVSQFEFDGKAQGNPGSPRPMPDALRRQFGGIDRIIPVQLQWTQYAQIPQKTGKPLRFDNDERVFATDTNYFRMVPYQWLAGDPVHALSQPNQVVLTQSRATKYFPGLSPEQLLNRTMAYWDTLNVQVVGVVADLPYPSDFSGKEFLSISTLKPMTNVNDEWGSTNSDTQLYLMLNAQTNRQQLLAKINALSKKRSEQAMKKWGDFKRWHLLQPLADLHFGVDFRDQTRRANKNVLLGLIGLAGFILALAVSNYINLASAQVPQRAREIGIRKTLGSRRRSLIFQFLGETASITLLAFGLAYALSQFFFARFDDLIPAGIDNYANWSVMLLFLAILLVSVTLLAGLYPGWLIARFQPVAVLRGQTGYTVTDGRGWLTLRKSLIVFQFFIAQLFIVGSVILGQQLQYSLQADMGFVRDAVLTATVPWKSAEYKNVDKRFTLKQDLLKLPGVAAVSLGNQPASDSYSSNTHELVGKKRKIELNMYRKYVDTDYVPLYKLPLVAGRNIQSSDTVREYVINETAARVLGFNRPSEAVGSFLKEVGVNRVVPIVGVVRDFHTRSFREKIQPIALMTDRESLNGFNIKLASGQPADWQKTIADISRLWKQFYPDAPFDYKFYDQTLEEFYKEERQSSRIVNLATTVAILISCLGLFGLATLTAHQRTKEIGIRKVLGASVAGVVALLSKDFLTLVVMAVVLASPLAWWAVNRYLENFAYRIELSGWVFAGAGLLAVTIALLTVSYQSIKAALVNPVKSLRSQ